MGDSVIGSAMNDGSQSGSLADLRSSAMSTFRGITRRKLVRNSCLLTPYVMFRSPVNDDDTTFPAGVETVTFVGRPFSLD